jgi:hypothetical protein
MNLILTIFMHPRLYAGTDYRGKMCGFDDQSSSLNTSLLTFPLKYNAMNVTAVLDSVVGGYFSSDNATVFDPASVGADMATLLDPAKLWEAHGTALLANIDSYFAPVCTNSCGYNVTAANDTRQYVWTGPRDPSMRAKWDLYANASRSTPSLMTPFTFKALPLSVCPYDASACVPLEFSPMTTLFGEYCVPSVDPSNSLSYITDAASNVVHVDFGVMVGDIKTSWKLILAMAFGSLIISLLFLWVMRIFVRFFVWICIALGFLLILFGAIFALLYAQKCVGESIFSTAKSVDTKDEALAMLGGTSVCPTGFSIASSHARRAIEVFGYVLFATAVLYVVLIIWFRRRINLAVAINKVATQFIRQCKRSLLIPSSQTLLTIGWWALWLVVVSYSLTIIPPGYRNMKARWINDYPTAVSQCRGESGVVIDDYTSGGDPIYACKAVRYILNWQFAYSIVYLFWVNAFILGVGEMIVAGAVGVWYFTPNHAKGTLGGYPLRLGFRNTFVYHLGTVAFGSLVLAIIRIIRIVFFWTAMISKSPTINSPWVRCLLVPIFYIVSLIKKLVSLLSRNALIHSALFGTNFYRSCASAAEMIAANPARLGALHVVTALVEIVGLALITAATGFSGWALLAYFYDGKIRSPLLPVIVMCIVGFGIGLVVMSLLSTTVAAILQCFLADEELHKAEGGAKFTPALLQRFFISAEAKDAGIQQNHGGAPAEPIGGQPISIVQ